MKLGSSVGGHFGGGAGGVGPVRGSFQLLCTRTDEVTIGFTMFLVNSVMRGAFGPSFPFDQDLDLMVLSNVA